MAEWVPPPLLFSQGEGAPQAQLIRSLHNVHEPVRVLIPHWRLGAQLDGSVVLAVRHSTPTSAIQA